MGMSQSRSTLRVLVLVLVFIDQTTTRSQSYLSLFRLFARPFVRLFRMQASMIGLVFLCSSRRRLQHVYNQIMACMFAFDSITGLAFLIGPGFTPVTELGEELGFYGASGNETTCQISGFMVQLGLSSMFFVVSLLVYYHLVIVYGWRTNQLRKIRLCFLLVPTVIGVSLAGAGINRYGAHLFGCWVLSFPLDRFWKDVTFLAAISFGISLLAITVLALQICWHVYRKGAKEESKRKKRRQSHRHRPTRPEDTNAGNMTGRQPPPPPPPPPVQSPTTSVGKYGKQINLAAAERGEGLPVRPPLLQRPSADDGLSRPRNPSERSDYQDGPVVQAASGPPTLDEGVIRPPQPPVAPNNTRDEGLAPDRITESSPSNNRRLSGSTKGADWKAHSLEKKAFWSAVSYLASFWFTWPVLIGSMIAAKWDFYWFGVFVFFISPMAGLHNFLIFSRPYLTTQKGKEDSTNDGSGGNGNSDINHNESPTETGETERTNDENEIAANGWFQKLRHLCCGNGSGQVLSCLRNWNDWKTDRYATLDEDDFADPNVAIAVSDDDDLWGTNVSECFDRDHGDEYPGNENDDDDEKPSLPVQLDFGNLNQPTYLGREYNREEVEHR